MFYPDGRLKPLEVVLTEQKSDTQEAVLSEDQLTQIVKNRLLAQGLDITDYNAKYQQRNGDENNPLSVDKYQNELLDQE